MATYDNRDRTVRLRYPEGLRLAIGEEPGRGAAGDAFGERPLTRGEAPAGREAEGVVAALSGRGLRLLERFDLEPGAGATRSRADEPVRLEVTVEAGKSAAVLTEQDGLYTWSFPAAPPRAAGDGTRSAEGQPGARVLSFELPLAAPPPPAATRSLGDLVSGATGRVRSFVLELATGWAVEGAVRLLERDVGRGLVRIASPDPADWRPLAAPPPALPSSGTPRLLLLVHGTFSSTLGSFGQLGATRPGRDLLAAALERYDLVLGFDHPTLSLDPGENAAELLTGLEALPWPRPPVIDAVAFSRGGLVLRSLVEQLLPASGWGARCERAVLVGATNAGTLLAEPDNWRTLIDLYTNLAVASARLTGWLAGSRLAGDALGAAFASLGAFARLVAGGTIGAGGIPGLAAMEPDGQFVRELNRPRPERPAGPAPAAYFAVTSDFESRLVGDDPPLGLTERVATALADPLVDRVMGRANDLVVDTASMTAVDRGEPGGGGRLRETLAFGTNPGVYHTVYFAQPRLVEGLGRWLDLPVGSRSAAEFLRPRDLDEVRLAPAPAVAAQPEEPAAGEPPVLEVEVVWGDIRRAEGDVYAVGHYVGVEPQRAELALDEMVSGAGDEPAGGRGLVLTEHTRRGLLRGELGEVQLFPWAGEERPSRTVAVCGMGHPGTFGEAELRRLHRNLAWTLLTLPGEHTLCTVLIGSGEGGLTPRTALEGMLRGFGEALAAGRGGERGSIRRVRIVELERTRAEELLRELVALPGEPQVELRIVAGAGDEPRVTASEGGRTDDRYRLAQLLEAARRAARPEAPPARKGALTTLLGPLAVAGAEGADIDRLKAELGRILERGAGAGGVARLASAVELTAERAVGAVGAPAMASRISFVRDGRVIRAAAITDHATVPERLVGVDPRLIDQAVRRMTDPASGELPALSRLLERLLVDRRFRLLLAADGPLVFELDRHTARIHWEMLAAGGGADAGPVGLRRPLARQLRTTYSGGAPSAEPAIDRRLRALVIGDPAGGEHALPGARAEALAVEELLSRRGVEVSLMIGPPGGARSGELAGRQPASRIDLLSLLLEERFDLVHFAGHGAFDDEDDPSSEAGWLFDDGLLTAREIERLERVPPLVVANACVSARLSRALAGRGGAPEEGEAGADDPWREASLLPGLADEFFRRGVRNYVGTAWRIDDQGALDFAQELYAELLPAPGGAAARAIGDALLSARRALHRARRKHPQYRELWAAYQHYGDPRWRFGRGGGQEAAR